MPTIIAAILYLGGLAMFWLYFHISNNAQSSVPDEHHQGHHVPADEYGEYLTDQEHELLRLADEPHRQRQRQIREEEEEEHMMLECWDRGKEPTCSNPLHFHQPFVYTTSLTHSLTRILNR